MVKFVEFDLEPTNSDNLNYLALGNCTASETYIFDNLAAFQETLIKPDLYMISFDQSTMNTGIYLINSRRTKAYMCEVKRLSGTSSLQYTISLSDFLEKRLDHCVFTDVFYEAPLDKDQKSKGFVTTEVLFYLSGCIRALSLKSTAFSRAQFHQVRQSQWWNAIIDPADKYLGTKTASKKAVESLFPFTQLYGLSINSDNDGYEAVGIMYGGMTCFNDYGGNRYLSEHRMDSKGLVSFTMVAELEQLGRLPRFSHAPNELSLDSLTKYMSVNGPTIVSLRGGHEVAWAYRSFQLDNAPEAIEPLVVFPGDISVNHDRFVEYGVTSFFYA